ncbi:hypothetical protein L1049_003161 [Liquidambar formosana]|uniref:Uncharacterized protein n=1 Tax=Liquidambar formosana TaxID=63359 RepID=A0AAP0NLS3_LIQFO
MKSASLSSPPLSGQPFSVKLPRRRSSSTTRNVVTAMRGTNGRDYGGKLVDESMIVLRIRIREMKMLETNHVPPSDWMEWEKRYFKYYDSDICEAVGLLQSLLMNMRPSLAIGIAVLIALSVPLSTAVLMFHAVEITKGILSGIHLIN